MKLSLRRVPRTLDWSAAKRLSVLGAAVAVLTFVSPAIASSDIAAAAGGKVSFTSGTLAQFTAGSASSFVVQAQSDSAVTFSWSGSLPPGLSFSDRSDSEAVISGAPNPRESGDSKVQIVGVNKTGAHATEDLDIDVHPISPRIPVVLEVSAASRTATTVQIEGLDLKSVTTVMFGSTPSPSFTQDGDKIVAEVPRNLNSGMQDVTLVDGTVATSPLWAADEFTHFSAPHTPVITDVSPVGGGFLVDWDPSPTSDDVSSYTIHPVVVPGFVAGAPGTCTSPPSVQAPGGSTTVLITSGVCSGVPYEVTMTATNFAGTSGPSNVSDTVIPEGPIPPAPPHITRVLNLSGALRVYWDAPFLTGGATISSYTAAASTTPDGTPAATSSATSTDTTISGLTNGTTYYVTVTAHTSAGTSLSDYSEGTPQAVVPSSGVASLSVVPLSNDPTISVSWQPPSELGTGTLTGYALTWWEPQATCEVTTRSSLGPDWQAPAALKVSSTKCAAKAKEASIDEHLVHYTVASNGVLKLSTGGDFAISAGTSLTYVTGARAISLSSGATSETLKGLAATGYYDVAITPITSAGVGPAVASSIPVTPTVKLAARASVLSKKTMDSLLSNEPGGAGDLGDELVFPPKTSFGASAKPGGVIIGAASSAAPSGVFGVVQSIWTESSGDVVVETMPAAATQGFARASFSYVGVLPSGTTAESRALTSGVSALSQAGGDPSFNFDVPGVVSGSMSFTPYVSVSASINCTHSWLGICYSWDLAAQLSAGLNSTASVTVALAGSNVSLQLSSIPLPDIAFSIGPIPIVITEEVDLNFLAPSGTLSLTASADLSMSGTVGWTSSNGFYHSGSSSITDGGTGLHGTGGGTVTLQVEYQACLYTVLCGAVDVNGNLTIAIQNSIPWFQLCPSASVQVSFGIQIQIPIINIGWSASFVQATLWSSSGACFTITAPPVTLSITPSASTVPVGSNVATIVASRSFTCSSSPCPDNNWELLNPVSSTFYGGGDSLTQSSNTAADGILSTGGVGGDRMLVIQDTDSATPNPIGSATTTVVVGNTYLFNTPAISLSSGPPYTYGGPPSYKLSWTAPAQTAGEPIAYYLVTVNGVTSEVARTSLPVFPTYGIDAFSVVAVNTVGRTSPTATLFVWLGPLPPGGNNPL